MNRDWSVAVLLLVFAASAQAQYVADSIDVGGAWVGSLVYVAQQDEIWGTSTSASRLFALSCESSAVVAAIPVHWAGDLAHDSTDGKLYVAYYGSGMESLAVVSVATRAVVRKLEMPGSTTPVWDPVSDRIYVTSQTTNRVAVLDCATDSLLTYIPVGACPLKMYINILRRKLYVLNSEGGSVSIIDLATNEVIQTVAVGGNPNAGYYCRRADKFYCAASFGYVAAIDGRSDSVVARVPVAAHGEVLSATGNEQSNLVMVGVYTGSSFVYTVNAATDSVMDSLQVVGVPYGAMYSEITERFYVTNYSFGSVSVIAGDGSHIVKTLSLGDDPFVFTKVTRHDRIYVGDLSRRWVYIVRDSIAGASENADTPCRSSAAITVIPNPFARAVRVKGCSPNADVRVYSGSGGLIRTLTSDRTPRRKWEVLWDGLDSDGRQIPVGVYLLESGTGSRVKVVKAR